MPWFKLDITDEHGVRHSDHIQGSGETEARLTVEAMGFTVNHIQVNRRKTLIAPVVEWIDRCLSPRKYSPETAFEYELERVRKQHPELDD